RSPSLGIRARWLSGRSDPRRRSSRLSIRRDPLSAAEVLVGALKELSQNIHPQLARVLLGVLLIELSVGGEHAFRQSLSCLEDFRFVHHAPSLSQSRFANSSMRNPRRS